MNPYKTIAISTKLAEKVRTLKKSPGYGHPAFTEVATGYGPCRHCLRTFNVGRDERTLFTYDPFHCLEPVPQPGPVFIHAGECERFPEEGGYPHDMLAHAAVLDAYGRGQRLVASVHVATGEHQQAVDRLLGRADVDYIQVRDREAGCFDFRIERVNENQGESQDWIG